MAMPIGGSTPTPEEPRVGGRQRLQYTSIIRVALPAIKSQVGAIFSLMTRNVSRGQPQHEAAIPNPLSAVSGRTTGSIINAVPPTHASAVTTAAAKPLQNLAHAAVRLAADPRATAGQKVTLTGEFAKVARYISEHEAEWKKEGKPFHLKRGTGGLKRSIVYIPEEGAYILTRKVDDAFLGKGSFKKVRAGYRVVDAKNRIAEKVAYATPINKMGVGGITEQEKLVGEAVRGCEGSVCARFIEYTGTEGKAKTGMLMPLMGQDLYDELYDGDDHFRTSMTAKERSQIALDVARALDELHTKAGYLHLDLKPENIISNGAGRYLLSDFSIARPVGVKKVYFAGTPGYVAPELKTEAPSEKADVFAFGVVLAQLCGGGDLFPDSIKLSLNDWEESWKTFDDKELNIPQERAWRRLISRCCAYDKRFRPSVKEVVTELEKIGRWQSLSDEEAKQVKAKTTTPIRTRPKREPRDPNLDAMA